MLITLFISLWQQAKENPYITDDLNALDFKATLFLFCTIFAGFFAFESNTSFVEAIVLVFVLLLNVYFVWIWIRKMIVLKISLLGKYKDRRCLKFCLKYLEKLEEGLFLQISDFFHFLFFAVFQFLRFFKFSNSCIFLNFCNFFKNSRS